MKRLWHLQQRNPDNTWHNIYVMPLDSLKETYNDLWINFSTAAKRGDIRIVDAEDVNVLKFAVPIDMTIGQLDRYCKEFGFD